MLDLELGRLPERRFNPKLGFGRLLQECGRAYFLIATACKTVPKNSSSKPTRAKLELSLVTIAILDDERQTDESGEPSAIPLGMPPNKARSPLQKYVTSPFVASDRSDEVALNA